MSKIFRTLPARCLAALVVITALTALPISAKDVNEAKGARDTFTDLAKSLTIDDTPLARTHGVMTSYADILEGPLPAVVSVFTTKEVHIRGMEQYRDHPLYRRFFGIPDGEDGDERKVPEHGPKEQGLGSGVIITSNGYILTNNHVIEGADEIKVSLPKRRQEFVARVVGSDKATDVAILKIEAVDLPVATLADSSKLRVGDVVLAIGNPFELERSVTMGIVSALGRRDLNIVDYADFIQTDAPINPGNSGGAIIDAQGRIVGINTAIQGGGGMGMSVGNVGIGFAIPINMILDIVERLFQGDGKVERGFLGVRLRPMDANWAEALGRKNFAGALVDEVVTGTPASRADFHFDDLIVEFEGEQVEDANKLRLDIGNTPPGTEVTFKVIRDGKPKEVVAKLGRLDPAMFAGRGGPGRDEEDEVHSETFLDGVEIVDLTPRVRALNEIEDEIEGVFVEGVESFSAAAEGGMRPGDIIEKVNRNPVASVADVLSERKKFNGNVIILRVYSPSREQSNSIIVRVK
ncbi:MAG: Do family serine endopeptidase [Verrucomicrobiales bacterium]